ncbi:MAG TPA: hypothetical protein VG270_08445 [Pseudolabrys sp.]|nr:hypothetical protein [Pseudolabrys sp.]
MIAATARDLGATLITRDSSLLGYAKQGTSTSSLADQ